MGQLDMLDMNLIVPEDIPVLLQMLDVAVIDKQTAFEMLEAHSRTVDMTERRQRLREEKPYAPFCP